MPLRARELRLYIRPYQVQSQLRADYARPQAEYIDVIILHALMGGKDVVTRGRADTAEFISRDASAGAAATQEDGSLRAAVQHGFGDGLGVIRIVHRIGGVRPEIHDFVTFTSQLSNDPRLDREAPMVGSDRDFHVHDCTANCFDLPFPDLRHWPLMSCSHKDKPVLCVLLLLLSAAAGRPDGSLPASEKLELYGRVAADYSRQGTARLGVNF